KSKMLDALNFYPEGATKRMLRDKSNLGNEKCSQILEIFEHDGEVRRFQSKKGRLPVEMYVLTGLVQLVQNSNSETSPVEPNDRRPAVVGGLTGPTPTVGRVGTDQSDRPPPDVNWSEIFPDRNQDQYQSDFEAVPEVDMTDLEIP
ncbi:MAG: hypothetical protein JWM11_3027, partial [Planctomycetaceae bacterium]|nr:hypothetical protein [Planctomycetaceae bacterium]